MGLAIKKICRNCHHFDFDDRIPMCFKLKIPINVNFVCSKFKIDIFFIEEQKATKLKEKYKYRLAE